MGGNTLGLGHILVLVITTINNYHSVLGSDNKEGWNVVTFVEPVGKGTVIHNRTTKGIEIPEETAEESAGSKLLFSSPELDDNYANTSSVITSSILTNPAQYLVLQFSSTVLVKNLDDGREYSVSELHSVDEEMSKLTVKDPQHNATSTCSFHNGGFGQATTGIRCRTSRNFPEECFCWDKVC